MRALHGATGKVLSAGAYAVLSCCVVVLSAPDIWATDDAGALRGAVGAPPGWRTAEDYSRGLFQPLQRYSCDAVQAMVEAIRAEGRPVPTGHPRIFIRPGYRDALREKIATHYAEWMQEAVQLADESFGKTLTELGGHSKEPAAQPVVLACGLTYQLGRIPGITYKHTPEEYGRDGVKHLLSLLKGTYEHREYLGLPLGYDWLYDLLTPGQRETVARQLLENARPGPSLVVPYNNPAGARLLGALAVRGDGIDDAEAERLLALFHGGMVFGDQAGDAGGKGTPRNITANHIFVPEGPGIEGIGYSLWYNPFYPFLEAWYDQTGEDYFKLPFFQNWIFHYTHIVGNEHEHHDKYARVQKRAWLRGCPTVGTMFEMSLGRSNRTAASLAKHQHEGQHRYVRLSVRIIYMLRADPTVEAKSPAELGLPTTAHFRVVNSVFMRNSWEGVDTAWAWFQSPTWSHVRDLGPVNDFNIWKHGGFLICKRETSHDYDGGNRTNTFVLYDEREPGKTFIIKNCMDRAHNRGLGLPSGASLRDLHTGLPGYTEGLRYFEERPGEYVYCLGDGARAFEAGRLENWSRQFIWFRADSNDDTDHFVVFDRMTKAAPGITEHMLLNFNMVPQIRDRQSNADLGEGRMQTPGIWVHEGANRIVATNTVQTDWGQAHGRAFVDTLLPKDPVYYRMGGVQEQCIDLLGNLGDKRLTGSPDDPKNIVAGMWRVQITAQQNRREQLYLHTIQAVDASVETPDHAQLLEGKGIVGARVGPTIALFSPAESTVSRAEVAIPLDGTFRVLLCDLEPGARYSVSLGATATQSVATGQGTCYFPNAGLQRGDVVVIEKAA